MLANCNRELVTRNMGFLKVPDFYGAIKNMLVFKFYYLSLMRAYIKKLSSLRPVISLLIYIGVSKHPTNILIPSYVIQVI